MAKKPIPIDGIVEEPDRALGDAWTWTAVQKLIHPDPKTKHVKLGAVYIPAEFAVTPNVSLQIVASAGSSMLRWFSVKINAIDGTDGGRTQVAVHAQTIHGGTAVGQHFVTISLTGVPTKSPKI